MNIVAANNVDDSGVVGNVYVSASVVDYVLAESSNHSF